MDIEEILVFLRNQNYLDIALYVIFIYALLSGWRKGSFLNIYYLLTLVLGIGLGFRYSNFFGLFIQTWLNSETQISKVIAGVIIILGISTASSVLLSILPSRLKANPIDFGSRFFGSIFSFIWVNFFFCIFFSFVSLFSLPNTVKQINEESKLISFYVSPNSFPQEVLSRITGTDLLLSINRIKELTGKTSYVDGCLEIIQAKEIDIRTRDDLAQDLISSVNRHRLDLSIDFLETRQSLSDVAEDYAIKMYREGFFCHLDPSDGSSVDERLRGNNINFNFIGENLSLAASMDLAHQSLLQSARHKETIESSLFRHIGIGVVEGPIGFIVVQIFTGG